MTYIPDSCALIAVFNTEPGADTVRRLLTDSLSGETRIIMSPVNLTEVYYDRIKVVGTNKAKEIYGWIKTVITVSEIITDSVVLEAGRLKSLYKIPLGDCFGLAAAVEHSGTFVTADHHELDAVEKAENIPFL